MVGYRSQKKLAILFLIGIVSILWCLKYVNLIDYDFIIKLKLKETRLEMARRVKTIARVCEKEGLGMFANKSRPPKVTYPVTALFEAFYFDQVDSLAWCPVYKAGSTSWLSNFCKLGGVNHKVPSKQISEVARKVWPSLSYEEGAMAFDQAIVRFFVVRHPFERLVSAYRDKLENKTGGIEHGTMFFYKKFGAHIVSHYRKKKKKKGQEYPPGGEPTFQEFVTYLIDINLPSQADEHWIPIYIYCTPCTLQYNAVVKLSTMDSDQNYIIKEANLEHKIKPTWKHRTKGQTSVSLIKKYFSTITKQELKLLYNKYRLDFELFEYSIDDYYSFVV